MITRVQSKAGNSGGTATTTVTLTSNATVGNTLLIGMRSAGFVSSVKYGANSFAYMASGSGGTLAVVRVVEVSKTIVVTTSASTRTAVIVVEYSGTLVDQDIPLLYTTGGPSTTNATGTLATTTYANELIVAVMSTGGATSTEQTNWLTGITNSFVSVLQTSTSVNVATDTWVAFLERFVTSTGNYSTAGTMVSAGWQNGIASFVEGHALLINPGMTGGMR